MNRFAHGFRIKKTRLYLVKAKAGQDALRQIKHADNFVLQLVGQAKNVGVVLGKAADAKEAVQGARTFVAVNKKWETLKLIRC